MFGETKRKIVLNLGESSNMERNVYKFNFEINGVNIPSKPTIIDFNFEFGRVMNYIMLLPKEGRRIDLSKSKKVIYLENFKYEQIENKNVYYMKFVSLKYNQTREVLNKETLESKGRLKDLDDGDKECNHLVIVECNNIVKAAFEYNYYGINSFGNIIRYLNDMCELFFKSIDTDKYFILTAYNEVNSDFLQELRKMKKINFATIVIEANRLGNTDFGNIAGRDEIKDEIELTFRKEKKHNISADIIENYYNEKNNGIKRIYVSGRNSNNTVKLDTEAMKEKVRISVSANTFGEINSADMFESLKNYLLGE